MLLKSKREMINTQVLGVSRFLSYVPAHVGIISRVDRQDETLSVPLGSPKRPIENLTKSTDNQKHAHRQTYTSARTEDERSDGEEVLDTDIFKEATSFDRFERKPTKRFSLSVKGDSDDDKNTTRKKTTIIEPPEADKRRDTETDRRQQRRSKRTSSVNQKYGALLLCHEASVTLLFKEI
eukprot:GHVR01054858.1.p1 GENE.GHVR01054858.1~~GHVR01054858.1.p1  ORF type:complete len:180 (-),score=26.18 GHVR01054858.1:366-905(-)